MIRKLFRLSLIAILAAILLLLFANFSVEKSAEQKTFDDVKLIPKNKVGLVLGTAKILKNGRVNLYFKYRIEACLKLYNSGKIDFVLISGDNGRETYDEPTDFKEELIRRGIPESKIFLDFAGFRTLDSVVRAKEIFGLSSLTFVSQKFHNERAIYLSEKNGMKAVAYNAKDVSQAYGFKVRVREYLARVKALTDVIFNVQPKFLGKSIEIS